MDEDTHDNLYGYSSLRYGAVSLIASCLVIASPVLIVIIGVFLWLVAFIPLALVGVISGLLGVGTGIYYKKWQGILTGGGGLILIGSATWIFIQNLMNF